ncbi:hypothetical protein CPC16_006896 [Podila verticillata]|uniref:Guanine nucleotide-binding protein subunit gamma n=1 Tax=Podila verticillata NRRL 6337 TaxID=1069443 RepID=A0A086TMI2_9FUNG|nr:hypothetical protein BGZ52_008396 [Haplosporangium bisporale]KAF9387739.1 hypothetical protein CPC16_006896 [Podila verticillata]KFH63159.1 hypothetical protein MVEG_11196 [Podila verticillata NRRL 6337]
MSSTSTADSPASSSGPNNNNSSISTGPLRSPSLSSNMGMSSATSSTANNSSATMATGNSLSMFGNSTSGTLTGGAASVGMMGGSSGVSDQKLKRFLEHNQRLKEQLEMRRISVSEASQSLIQYVSNTRDALIPIIWGTIGSDPFSKQTTSCCTIS